MYKSVVISGRAFRRSEYASMLPGMGLPFWSTGATVSKDFSLSTSTRTRTERLSNSGRQKLIRDFDSLPSITEKQRSLPGGIGHWSPQPMRTVCAMCVPERRSLEFHSRKFIVFVETNLVTTSLVTSLCSKIVHHGRAISMLYNFWIMVQNFRGSIQ